jgi:hypothetical protein
MEEGHARDKRPAAAGATGALDPSDLAIAVAADHFPSFRGPERFTADRTGGGEKEIQEKIE